MTSTKREKEHLQDESEDLGLVVEAIDASRSVVDACCACTSPHMRQSSHMHTHMTAKHIRSSEPSAGGPQKNTPMSWSAAIESEISWKIRS